jgi:hypothetical protein
MKKIVLITSVAAVIYLATKFNTNTKALEQVTAKIKRLKKVNISNGNINLKIDLNLTNLSNYNLGIETFNLLTVKQLRFYNAKNRMLIGAANVNISNIELPSKQSVVLADIIAEIPTNNLLNHVSLFVGNAAENVKVVPVFNAAGKDFEINPENYI